MASKKYKIRASRTSVFGVNSVYEAFGAYFAKRYSGEVCTEHR